MVVIIHTTDLTLSELCIFLTHSVFVFHMMLEIKQWWFPNTALSNWFL